MQVILTVCLWLFIGGLTSYFAKQRGRDEIGWFLLGMFLGIFGLFLLFILPSLKNQEEAQKIQSEEMAIAKVPSPIALEKKNFEGEIPLIPINEWQDKDWYYLDQNNKQQGPVFYTTLKRILSKEKCLDQSLVWSEGMSEWKRSSDLPKFWQE